MNILNNRTKDIYILSRLPGIGSAALKKILGEGFRSISALASEVAENDLKLLIKGKHQRSAIEIIKYNLESHIEKIESEIHTIYEKGICIFGKNDKEYPKAYNLIKDAPIFIYAKGNFDLLNLKDSIAIIGSRNCSEIAYEAALKTSRYFAEKKFNIVSGLAKGIDTAAHEGALSAPNGKTTAILVDIDIIYPHENKELSDRILKNDGLLISENPPGTMVRGNLLVKRNRLQSGMSLATFPIETKVKGGTMHTVCFSEEQNRLLFCPDFSLIKDYRINEMGEGVKKLLNDGRASSFTKNSYDDLILKLEKKKNELYRKDSKGLLSKTQKQTNLFK
jgi:DNA processing protein